MDKALAISQISSQIKNCKICRQNSLGEAVPGEGNPDARIVFIGEAPGKTEARTGRPFVGRSGQLLRSLIRQAGLAEEEVYITSPVKRLPKRGTPTRKQIIHGKTHLDRQLTIIDPEIVVLLGSVATFAILGKRMPVLKEHGKLIKDKGKTYMLTLHPAAVIRFPKYKKLILEDFEKLTRLIH